METTKVHVMKIDMRKNLKFKLMYIKQFKNKCRFNILFMTLY